MVGVVGDWMGSIYDMGGRRWDFHFFLDHNGRYERAISMHPVFELRDSGEWTYQEAENWLRLEPHTSTDERSSEYKSWRVLSVNGCEASNVLLVLREAILASRNLPITFYRVHCNHRGYGTGWEKNLATPEGLDKAANV